MLVNRAIGALRALSPRSLRLRMRAASRRRRIPVVLVPPMLGTRLRDARGRRIWGWTRNLFTGPMVGSCGDVVLDGPLEALRLVPGVYGWDVLGGMIGCLARVGGYVLGRDLFVFEYDWRRGVAFAACGLAELVEELTSAGEKRVDLVCASSGGLVARYFWLYGGRDMTSSDRPEPTGDTARRVRRVIYLGTPQRGTLEAINVLHNGFGLVPLLGRHYAARDIAVCQIAYDLLPHPDDAVGVDHRFRPVALHLYDARTWRDLGIAPSAPADLEARLERAWRLHRALERPGPRQDAFLVGARHRPTRARLVVSSGRAELPSCWMEAYPADSVGRPGDGSVTVDSMRALPGVSDDRIRYIEPGVHHDIVADPDGHATVLELLLRDEAAESAGA